MHPCGRSTRFGLGRGTDVQRGDVSTWPHGCQGPSLDGLWGRQCHVFAAGNLSGICGGQPPGTGADGWPAGGGDGRLEELDGAPGADDLDVYVELVHGQDAEDVQAEAADGERVGRLGLPFPRGGVRLYLVHDEAAERADVLLGLRPRAAGVAGGLEGVPSGAGEVSVGFGGQGVSFR